MTVRHRLVQVLGGFALAVGVSNASLILHFWWFGHFIDWWKVVGDILLASLSVSLIDWGLRSFRYGNLPDKPTRGVGWVRTTFGAWIIFLSAKNHFLPAPNLLKASNQVQALVNAAEIAMSILGISLVIWGARNPHRGLPNRPSRPAAV